MARTLIIILSLVGLGIMAYLTYIHYANVQSFCDITQEVSCDVVTTSIYSEIFGVPVSVLGLLYFAGILALMLYRKKKEVFQAVFLLTLFALIPSLYLSLTEFLFIKSICILCETSKVLMFGILIASFAAARSFVKIDMRLAAPVIIAGLVASGITYFAQVGNVSREDHSELAACLNERGVIYYKSVRCSSCRRQEQLLGAAYAKLNSVECHPEGENPQVELCLKKRIEKTPTFLLEKNGVEIKRLEGLQQVEALASFAGCKLK